MFPVKRVKIMLKNITKTYPVKITPDMMELSKCSESVAQSYIPEAKSDSSVDCVVCVLNFRDQAGLSEHYCYEHFYEELESLMPQYLGRNTCKVCGLEFLNLNITNIMSHIGIDHKVLSLLLEELELNDKDELGLSDDDSNTKQVDTPPSMSFKNIQKILLPQNDLEEAVSKETISGGTSHNEIVAEDDEIIEVAVPPKPEAPLIDLELEEDDDSKEMSIIEDTLEDLQQYKVDNSNVSNKNNARLELNVVGGLADICEVLFK